MSVMHREHEGAAVTTVGLCGLCVWTVCMDCVCMLNSCALECVCFPPNRGGGCEVGAAGGCTGPVARWSAVDKVEELRS